MTELFPLGAASVTTPGIVILIGEPAATRKSGGPCARQHDGEVHHVRVCGPPWSGAACPGPMPTAPAPAREWERPRCSVVDALGDMGSELIGHLIAVVNSHGVGNHDG